MLLRGNCHIVPESGNNVINALSGLYLISTNKYLCGAMTKTDVCQCPLGLIPHFYLTSMRKVIRAITCVNALSGLYLISTPIQFNKTLRWVDGCQCPLGLIPHFYHDQYLPLFRIMSVSMPSRAYTSFLRYPFKNLGFMRFLEPVFAGIYQNILTTAVFRAC